MSQTLNHGVKRDEPDNGQPHFAYASRLDLPRGNPVAIAARDIAVGLSWAYGYTAARKVPAAWDKLQEAINSVCTAALEHASLSITATAVEVFATDQSILARLNALESALHVKKEDALRFAGSYLQAVQQVALDEDAWSEKSAALYPVVAPPPALATPDTQRLARLNALIDTAAEMALCGFAREAPVSDFE